MSNCYMRLLYSHNLIVGQVFLMFKEAYYFATNIDNHFDQ